MQIQITDRNIDGHEGLAAQVTGVVENALSRMSDHHLTRLRLDRNSRRSYEPDYGEPGTKDQ